MSLIFVPGDYMSPQAKSNVKFTIGVATSIITIIVFAFFLGVGFAENDTEHLLMQKDIENASKIEAAETKRSQAVDIATAKDIGEIKIVQKAMGVTLESQSKTLEKIEKKLP
jgi:hypothetical protein